MNLASHAAQAEKATSVRAKVDLAPSPVQDGSSAASAVVARDRLIDTIRRNVMAWTKWDGPDESVATQAVWSQTKH